MVSRNVLRARDTLSGATGAVACVYAGLPFDTIKARLQVSNATTSGFSGPVDCTVQTVRKEGFRALFKGASPALASALMENSVLFLTQGILMRTLVISRFEVGKTEPSTYDKILVGSASGVVSAFAICPAEVIKVNLQTQCTLKGTKSVSARHMVRRVFEQDGFRGFFRGLIPLWIRDIPFYGIFFGASSAYYSAMGGKENLHPAHHVVAGGLGGMAAWAVVFPADIVKSRLQVQERSKATILKTVLDLHREKGIRAFYRGWIPAVARGFPANGALLFGVQVSKQLFNSILGVDS